MCRFLILFLFLPVMAMASSMPTKEYHLKNGLTLIVREDHRAPVVYSSVWYRVGGSYEHDGITGISHMLEHMMFKGTKQYGPGVLNKMVNDNGGQQNAFTSNDYTGYYQVWSKDKLPLSFKLEADRMHNLTLDQSLYDKEHQVVMEERRMRVDDNPQAILWERFNAAAHVNNPYHHPTIGWMTDIQHLTLANLKHWYQTWYVPNNAVVVVVGDVQADHVDQLAQQYFGSLQSKPLPPVKPRTEIAGIGIRSLHAKLSAQVPWLVMGWNVPSLVTAKKSSEAYALTVLSAVLAGSDSSRFANDLVRGQQIAAGANAYYSPFRKYSDLLVLTGVPAQGHTIKELRQAFLSEVNQLKTQAVSAAELDRIKAQVIASKVYEKDSLSSQASDLAVPEMLGLSWKVSDQFVKNIEAVTPAEIQQAAKTYLNDNNLTVAVLQPV